jgi:predicted transcriptional regulator
MQPWYHATMETQAITVRLDKDVYERLRLAAFESRRSMAGIIGEAVAEKLDREAAQ